MFGASRVFALDYEGWTKLYWSLPRLQTQTFQFSFCLRWGDIFIEAWFIFPASVISLNDWAQFAECASTSLVPSFIGNWISALVVLLLGTSRWKSIRSKLISNFHKSKVTRFVTKPSTRPWKIIAVLSGYRMFTWVPFSFHCSITESFRAQILFFMPKSFLKYWRLRA